MIVTRFHGLEEIKLEVEFLTPTFLGGWDQNAALRSAPFKIGLRYWWRILYGNQHATTVALKKAEDSIFGSTELSTRVRIEVSGNVTQYPKTGFQKDEKIPVVGKQFKLNILDYLAYGHYENGNIYTHTHIAPCQKCVLHIYAQQDIRNQIIAAAKAFIIYGGLGSRSRNGFGSLMSTSLNILKWANDIFTFGNPKEYPVLSTASKLFASKQPHKTWESALSEIGIAYKAARCSLEPLHTFEKRGLIARPIEVKGESIPDNIRNGRHPKPFYLGVKKKNDKFFGQILSLPITFYELDLQKDYQDSLNSMHQQFAQSFNDETKNIISAMEANS